MNRYIVSIQHTTRRLIGITAIFPSEKKQSIQLQLPAWRPGRYELGQFAKNIQHIVFHNEKKQPLGFRKISKDCWEVQCENSKTVIATYTYFGGELNAGSSFANDQQLYVNPVNCFLYPVHAINEPCELSFDLPWDNYEVATSLVKKGKTFIAEDYHEMADSPFIASPDVTSFSFKVKNLPVTVWIMGDCQPDEKKIREDFTRYMKKQLEVFGDCPASEYHYFLQIVPGVFYHGVEHLKSTVVALGPGADLMGNRYDELLGVSCHEFYHVWNIKSIRPVEMLPYDYTKENYFETGYVAEGVTTYMGDLLLWQSDVFSTEQFIRELNGQIQKHADNPGRFQYSVAQSSFDLWLDGYVPGVAGRKVSIYTEGCLLALCADLMILKNTSNKASLHTVMKKLYTDFYKKNKGYTVQDYKMLLENVSGLKLNWYFEEYLHGTGDYFKLLNTCLEYVGMKLQWSPANYRHESVYGLKLSENHEICSVTAVYPGSPADAYMSPGDRIIAVNNQAVRGDAVKLIHTNPDETIKLTIISADRVREIKLTGGKKEFYPVWRFTRVDKPTDTQRKAFDAWKKGVS